MPDPPLTLRQALAAIGISAGWFCVWLFSRRGILATLEVLAGGSAIRRADWVRPLEGSGGYGVALVLLLGLCGLAVGVYAWDRARRGRLWERAVPSAPLWLSVFALGVGMVCAAEAPLRGDESMLLAAGAALRSEGIVGFFRGYTGLTWMGDRHPPLAAFVAALSVRADSLLMGRMVFMPFLVVAVLATRWIGARLYSASLGAAAGLALLCIRHVPVYATRASLDVPAMALVALAIAFALRSRDGGAGWALAAGMALASAVLTRYTAGLAVFPLAAIVLAGGDGRTVGERVGRLVIAGVPGVVLVGGWFVLLWNLGGLETQFGVIARHAVESQAGDGTPQAFEPWHNLSRAEALLLLLPSSLGVWMLPAIGLGMWAAVRERGPNEWGLAVWVVSVALPLVLTLPVPRYFMPVYPAFAILIALALRRVVVGRWSLLLLWLGLSVLALLSYGL